MELRNKDEQKESAAGKPVGHSSDRRKHPAPGGYGENNAGACGGQAGAG